MDSQYWVHHNARYARCFNSDFATVVRNTNLCKRGPDALRLLSPDIFYAKRLAGGLVGLEVGDVKNCELYTYYEPTREVLEAANVAGIRKVRYAICRRNECTSRDLLPVTRNHRFRREVLEYLRFHGRTPVKYSQENYDAACWLDAFKSGNVVNKLTAPPLGQPHLTWLKFLTKRFLKKCDELAYAVKEKAIASGIDPIPLMFEGGTLYTFFEPSPIVLEAAKKGGIKEARCVLSRFDELRIFSRPIQAKPYYRDQFLLLQAHANRTPVETGHDCKLALGLNNYPTLGTGVLSAEGHWEYPCAKCAREYERHFDIPCWPFETQTP